MPTKLTLKNVKMPSCLYQYLYVKAKPEIVAKPLVITVCSSDFVNNGKSGLIAKGASV